MGLTDLAKKLQITAPKLLALIEVDGLQSDPEYFKLLKIGKVSLKRYSPRALDHLRSRVSQVDLQAIWQQRRAQRAAPLK